MQRIYSYSSQHLRLSGSVCVCVYVLFYKETYGFNPQARKWPTNY